jgi:very-short-patch-repair endonuclease
VSATTTITGHSRNPAYMTARGRSHQAAAQLMNLAERQYGLFTRNQAHKMALSDDWLWRQMKSGETVKEYSNVFRFTVVAPSFHQRVKAFCLRAPGQIWASHRAAGALWGLDDVPPSIVEVTSIVNLRTNHPDVIVHRTVHMPRRDVTEVLGIPLTTVHRTLLDIGAVVNVDVVEAALESALRRNMTTIERIQRRLDDIGGSGRKGAGKLRQVLNRREPGAPPTASGLETDFSQLLRRNRLPQPTRQHVVHDDSGVLARVDFEYIGRDIVIEVDSREHHLRIAQWENDLKRRNRLTNCGKRVLHVTYRRMKTDEAGIAEEIREALRADRP